MLTKNYIIHPNKLHLGGRELGLAVLVHQILVRVRPHFRRARP
jgi:hypothetical protein